MINPDELTLKKLDRNGLKTLVDWAKAEGWNPGENDFDVFWKTDPDGYYGFYFEQTLIAGGAVVSYAGVFGFMGLFIVHPDYRGQGIGTKLWYARRDLLLSRLQKGASIGMDGVVDMQPFYEKGGFRIAFRDERHECTGREMAFSPNISSITREDFEKLYQYDQLCFGCNRHLFLTNWLTMPNSSPFKYSEGQELKGYAVIRKVNVGYKIGPLFADDDAIAEELYKACLNAAVGEPVFLDIPVINQGAVALVKKYDAKYTFECARMYHGDAPDMAMNKVYGITTFELG